MNEDFLIIEYQECYKNLRFYTDNLIKFIKIISTLFISIISILLILNRYFKDFMVGYYLIQGVICFIFLMAFIMLCFAYLESLANRFIIKEQINIIKKYFLTKPPILKNDDIGLLFLFPGSKKFIDIFLFIILLITPCIFLAFSLWSFKMANYLNWTFPSIIYITLIVLGLYAIINIFLLLSLSYKNAKVIVSKEEELIESGEIDIQEPV